MTAHEPEPNEQTERMNRRVDHVLSQILGKEAAETLYCHLEATHSIQRHHLAQELDLLNQALREYLGPGAAIIEHMLHKSLQPELEEDFGLPDRAKVLKLA